MLTSWRFAPLRHSPNMGMLQGCEGLNVQEVDDLMTTTNMQEALIGCFVVITPVDFAHAQPKKPTATEDTLAAKIKCQHFQKNSDGPHQQRAEQSFKNGMD